RALRRADPRRTRRLAIKGRTTARQIFDRLATLTTVAATLRNRMVRMSSQGRLLQRPAGAFTRHGDEAARDRKQPAYSAPASELSGASDAQAWAARQVREWLLLLLRFAVTSDAKDQSAALALADEIDARGLQWRPSAPTFFRRTTKRHRCRLRGHWPSM